VWNVLSESAGATSDSLGNLQTSTGVSTNVGVSFSCTSTYGDPTSPANALLGGTLIASSGNTGDVTLTGLTAGGNYTLYIYGQNAGYNSDITTYAITEGTGGPAAGQFDDTVDGGSTSGVFYNNSTNNNYTIFNATADNSGTLQISFTGGTPGVPSEGVFNGVQVVGVTVATPEPAALGLMAAAGLALLPLLRRRVHV
jgi:MYXO-CTERM domain-containing protein